jgi:uncharacterized coiled-coil protein SlyX
MSDLEQRVAKCEADIARLSGTLADVLDRVDGMLVQVDQVLVKVEASHRQMVANFFEQTETGFAQLRACLAGIVRDARQDN